MNDTPKSTSEKICEIITKVLDGNPDRPIIFMVPPHYFLTAHAVMEKYNNPNAKLSADVLEDVWKFAGVDFAEAYILFCDSPRATLYIRSRLRYRIGTKIYCEYHN